LRRDEDSDLVSDLKTAAALESFFGDKYLDMPLQFALILSRQPGEQRKFSLECPSPGRGKRLCPQHLPAASFAQAVHKPRSLSRRIGLRCAGPPTRRTVRPSNALRSTPPAASGQCRFAQIGPSPAGQLCELGQQLLVGLVL